jgi:hypothetical protein
MIRVIIEVMMYIKYTVPITVLFAVSEPMIRVGDMIRREVGRNMFQRRERFWYNKIRDTCQNEYKKGTKEFKILY